MHAFTDGDPIPCLFAQIFALLTAASTVETRFLTLVAIQLDVR